MGNRFIDGFDVILLDMGNTFMFGVDRFGDKEDYYATYRQLGGNRLCAQEVRAHIAHVFDRMLAAARNPAYYDDFGDVRRFLTATASSDLSPS